MEIIPDPARDIDPDYVEPETIRRPPARPRTEADFAREREAGEKSCTTCGVVKAFNEFCKNAVSPDGVQTGCRTCSRSAANSNAERNAYRHIIERTTNPNNKSWHRYGGRGIAMSQEFRGSFQAFRRHVGPRPSPSHSIDRINNDKGYERHNLRWATATVQANNQSPRVFLPPPPSPVQISESVRVPGGTQGRRVSKAEFKCHCGATFFTEIRSVASGHTKSCGCHHRNQNQCRAAATEVVQ